MTQKVIHIHEAYNLSLKDHEIIHEKENLSDIEKTLHNNNNNKFIHSCDID